MCFQIKFTQRHNGPNGLETWDSRNDTKITIALCETFTKKSYFVTPSQAETSCCAYIRPSRHSDCTVIITRGIYEIISGNLVACVNCLFSKFWVCLFQYQ